MTRDEVSVLMAGADLPTLDDLLARDVCATCTVRDECLAAALANTCCSPGVRGGTSERERRKLKHLSTVNESPTGDSEAA